MSQNSWTSVNKIGIAIWNYQSTNDHKYLSLFIGEIVQIEFEHPDWYYGFRLTNDPDRRGLFPRNYVQVTSDRLANEDGNAPSGQDSKDLEDAGNRNSRKSSADDNFELETVLTLYEWNQLLKKIFKIGDYLKYSMVRNLMFPLIEQYHLLRSGKLTLNELKRLRLDIVNTIDIGNKHLNLDLIIRHESDNTTNNSIINPFDSNDIIDYYEQHLAKYQKLRQIFRQSNDSSILNDPDDHSNRNSLNNNCPPPPALVNKPLGHNYSYNDHMLPLTSGDFNQSRSSYRSSYRSSMVNTNNYNDCYNFCVTISNFICMIKQDIIITMAIYDGANYRFLTENYVVKWEKTGFVREYEKINNIRVVFTDFSANDLFSANCQSKQLYLVCQVIRCGSMHLLGENDRKKQTYSMIKSSTAAPSTAKSDQDELKRPCGIAVYNLSEIIQNIHKPQQQPQEIKEIFVPLILYQERDDSLDSLLKKIVKDLSSLQQSTTLFNGGSILNLNTISSGGSGHNNQTMNSQNNINYLFANKQQGFILSILLFISYKMQLLDKYRLHYAQYPSYIARKLTFREIILPEDVRNDLYMTLLQGEFHKQPHLGTKSGKKSEKNVEVTVKLVDNQTGRLIENCFAVDSLNQLQSSYHSCVYYHEDRPKWMETIKIQLTYEQYSLVHLKFLFKHRSSNENKDKNERPFAFAYLRLMNADKTIVSNRIYSLFIYKYDHKKLAENDTSYLTLPSHKYDQQSPNHKSTNDYSGEPSGGNFKQQFTVNQKDSFQISIQICSTKLTNNLNILNLLDWKNMDLNNEESSLVAIIDRIQSLDGNEIMKFLYDILNALFEIWMTVIESDGPNGDDDDRLGRMDRSGPGQVLENRSNQGDPSTRGTRSHQSNQSDRSNQRSSLSQSSLKQSSKSFDERKIFNSLIFIIKHLLQDKYIHFQEILDEYIDRYFYATLIYMNLLNCFKYYVTNPDQEFSYITVTCMEFIFKFIIRSRYLYQSLNSGNGHNESSQNQNDRKFEQSLDELFTLFINVMSDCNFNSNLDDFDNNSNVNDAGGGADVNLNNNILKVRLGILKYFPKIIDNVIRIYDSNKLTLKLIMLLNNISTKQVFTIQKLSYIHECIDNHIYRHNYDCRRKLLPIISQHLRQTLLMILNENSYGYLSENSHNNSNDLNDNFIANQEKLDKCLAIIKDALKILIRQQEKLQQLLQQQAQQGQQQLIHQLKLSIKYDLNDLVLILLRPLVNLFLLFMFNQQQQQHRRRQQQHLLKKQQILLYDMLTILLTLFNQMNDYHYNELFQQQQATNEFELFVKSLLNLIELILKNVYPNDWINMIIVQNVVTLKIMKKLINFIKENLKFSDLQFDTWVSIFSIAIRYILQKSLNFESTNYSKYKLNKYLLKNLSKQLIDGHNNSINPGNTDSVKDLRIEMIVLIRSLWFYLGANKQQFIPLLIEPFLKLSLLSIDEIRRDIMIIFFDMYLELFNDNNQSALFHDEIIVKLDKLIIGNESRYSPENHQQQQPQQQDPEDEPFDLDYDLTNYNRMFRQIFFESSENHEQILKDNIHMFIQEIYEQIEQLICYRSILKTIDLDNDSDDDYYEQLSASLLDLLMFYDQINRKELFIRYLYKLYNLHLKHLNYIEAAYTLSKHAELLQWSDDPIDGKLSYDFSGRINLKTHRSLKEHLYYEIIENFDRGQLWEPGLGYCKELLQQYEQKTFDYGKLSRLLEKMSRFYQLIITSVRIEPEYFFVKYFGQKFPKHFRNKCFIYRGKCYERLFDFAKRIQKQFPEAVLLDRIDIDDDERQSFEQQSSQQYLSIYRVDTNVDVELLRKTKFYQQLIDERIVAYYQYNEIDTFIFSRKLIKNKGQSSTDNEFATMWIKRHEYQTANQLPNILYRSEIIDINRYELDPLENAIDTMKKMEEKLRAHIYRYLPDGDHQSSNQYPLHNLLMFIKGIVSSDVQGGVTKYEEAFFNDDNDSNALYDRSVLQCLRRLIVSQIPLLDLALKIAYQKQMTAIHNHQQAMDGLLQYIVESFEKMRSHVQLKYADIYDDRLPDDIQKIVENNSKLTSINLGDVSSSSNAADQSNAVHHRNSIDNGTMTLTKRSLFGRSNTIIITTINGSTTTTTTPPTTTLSGTLRFRRKDSKRLHSNNATTINNHHSNPTESHSNSVYQPSPSSSSLNLTQSQWYTTTMVYNTPPSAATIDRKKKSLSNLSFISPDGANNQSSNDDNSKQLSPVSNGEKRKSSSSTTTTSSSSISLRISSTSSRPSSGHFNISNSFNNNYNNQQRQSMQSQLSAYCPMSSTSSTISLDESFDNYDEDTPPELPDKKHPQSKQQLPPELPVKMRRNSNFSG